MLSSLLQSPKCTYQSDAHTDLRAHTGLVLQYPYCTYRPDVRVRCCLRSSRARPLSQLSQEALLVLRYDSNSNILSTKKRLLRRVCAPCTRRPMHAKLAHARQTQRVLSLSKEDFDLLLRSHDGIIHSQFDTTSADPLRHWFVQIGFGLVMNRGYVWVVDCSHPRACVRWH